MQVAICQGNFEERYITMARIKQTVSSIYTIIKLPFRFDVFSNYI